MMCWVHLTFIISPARYILLCWVCLDVETEVWGLVSTPQDVAGVGFKSRTTSCQALPILLTGRMARAWFCPDHVPEEPLASLWESQDSSGSLPVQPLSCEGTSPPCSGQEVVPPPGWQGGPWGWTVSSVLWFAMGSERGALGCPISGNQRVRVRGDRSADDQDKQSCR